MFILRPLLEQLFVGTWGKEERGFVGAVGTCVCVRSKTESIFDRSETNENTPKDERVEKKKDPVGH